MTEEGANNARTTYNRQSFRMPFPGSPQTETWWLFESGVMDMPMT